jgi:hypothetical protein
VCAKCETGRTKDGMAARVIVGELGRDGKHANGREREKVGVLLPASDEVVRCGFYMQVQ